jgi:two-component system response regulator (stage 0 sporulation protein F)
MDEKKTKILVVEDNETLRMVLKDSLQKEEGFEVWDAADGAIALDIIMKFSPDLALLDIDLPKIDGLTLAKMLAEKKLTDKTKIIFLTNENDISDINTASEIDGVLGYFIKSDWNIADVIGKIKAKLNV